ncbi:MAG: pyridoxal-phosphate-dependent aminotransferase family protein [Planctomycetota bacterium]
MLPPPEVLLLGPGPSPSSPAVQRAQSWPQLGHLDPAFLPILDGCQQGLRELFGTANALTLPLAGAGTAGMEALVANLVAPGDRVVVGVHGVFGQRWAESVRRRGGEVVEVRSDFGQPLDPAAFAAAVAGGPTALCCVVHAETSTGVLTDLAPFAGTQKCLSVPPGLAPVTFSPRALAKARQNPAPVPFYFDTGLLTGYFGPDRAYHYTAPITLLYALAASLHEIAAEGFAARCERHRRVSRMLRAGLTPLGLQPLVPAAHATPMLTTLRHRDGVDDNAFRACLLQRHGIEVGGGLGPLAGKVFRVGLMGHGARPENVLRALAAIGDALATAGQPADVAAALQAAHAAG